MFGLLDHTYDFDSYSRDELTTRYASVPARQRALFDSFVDAAADSKDCGKICIEKNRFFTGILITAPISALLWGLIFLAVKAIFL